MKLKLFTANVDFPVREDIELVTISSQDITIFKLYLHVKTNKKAKHSL